MKKEKTAALKILLEVLTRTCCIFTPVFVIFYSLGYLIKEALGFTSDAPFYPELSTMYILLALSFAVSLSVLLYRIPKISFIAAHIVNFVLFGFFYYFVVVYLRDKASEGGYTIVAMLLYVVIFAVVTLCIYGVKALKKKKITDVTVYQSRFEK